MNAVCPKNWHDLIIKGAESLGIIIAPDISRIFSDYTEELLCWNKKINLTSITDLTEIALKHFIDSIAVKPFLPQKGAMLDIGSGAGFPGIPLKIISPCLSVTLVDSSRKKVSFQKYITQILKLKDIDALHSRVQDLYKKGKTYDVIISRAFASLKDFVCAGLPLKSENGVIIAMKGKSPENEIKDLRSCLNKKDYKNNYENSLKQLNIKIEKYTIPYLSIERTLVFVY